MVATPKNPTTSTRKTTQSKGKTFSQPSEPVTIGFDHFEDFASSKYDISDDARISTDKSQGKHPLKDDVVTLIVKKLKMDLDSILESEINFQDTPNRDTFIVFKGKLSAHGRIVNLNDMESLN